MNLFFAGDYLFPRSIDIYILGYPRLLSYHYQRPLIDKLIEWREEGENLDLYLAGGEWEKEGTMVDVLELRPNLLFSYVAGKVVTDTYTQDNRVHKLFIDSGAYSAWTRGVEIDVDEYIDWINERADYIDLFGQIDVIPGDKVHGATLEQVRVAAEKTWENYLYMRERVKYPERLLYTFHVGEPIQYLEQALEWKDSQGDLIPYIALGGMVGKSESIRRSFLDSCFDVIRRSSNPNVKVHAFGMTSFKLLSNYPITSADSTTWIMTGANGGIMTDVGTVIVSEQRSNQSNHYSHLPKHLQKEFEETIAEYGFTLDELSYSRHKRIIFNARYMTKKASELVYNPGPKKLSLF